MDATDLSTVRLLLSLSQHKLFAHWDAPGTRDADKRRLLAQIRRLDADWDLRRYFLTARRLLSDAHRPPFRGWSVSAATRTTLTSMDNISRFEELGRKELGAVGVVLLGGGFGERLNAQRIKTALPSEVTTQRSYLELYISALLAFGRRCDAQIPFAVTTLG